MIDDMNVRRFTPDTQRDYIRAVKKLAAILGRSPDSATAEHLRAFQLPLTETDVRPPTISTIVTGLRFFFKASRQRAERRLPYWNRGRCRGMNRLLWVYAKPTSLTHNGHRPSGFAVVQHNSDSA